MKSSPVKAAAEEVTKNGVENGAGDAPEVKKNGGVTKTEEVEVNSEINFLKSLDSNNFDF